MLNKILSTIAFVILLTVFNNNTFAQEKTKKKDHDHKKMEMKHEHHKIDIDKIDKNKDGKIYQCPMCADQVSDEAGRCKHCEMKLKEYSKEDAKKSLKKYLGKKMKKEMKEKKDSKHNH